MLLDRRTSSLNPLSHSNAMMKRMDKLEKKLVRIEDGTTTALSSPTKRPKRPRASKAVRSKISRIELPPPEDGKPRSQAEIDELMAVELEYLNRAAVCSLIAILFCNMLMNE